MPHSDKSFEFVQRLQQVLAPGPAEFPYRRSYDSVKRVAQSLADWLAPNAAGRLQVRIEPGYQGALGQQLNVVLCVPDRHVRDTLFRVYVRPSGEMHLDLFGEETVPCAHEGQLQEQLLQFLAQAENKNRLNMYKDLLAQ